VEYKVGCTVVPLNTYDPDPMDDCAGGIHCHLIREDAFFWINQEAAFPPQLARGLPLVAIPRKAIVPHDIVSTDSKDYKGLVALPPTKGIPTVGISTGTAKDAKQAPSTVRSPVALAPQPQLQPPVPGFPNFLPSLLRPLPPAAPPTPPSKPI
jgi:hypothetical protein